MTKEEVSQVVNDYCSERRYKSEQLTDDFKDKFADFFVKKTPDGDINDEAILADLKFNIDTAYSASLRGMETQQQAFTTKEQEMQSQIDELKKKLGRQKPQETPVIPKEIQEQLDELKQYRNTEAKKAKFKEVLEVAKKGVREDLHSSFEKFVKDYDVDLEKDNKEQAERWVSKYNDVFSESFGDIRPLKPQQTQKRDEEFLASLPKVKVV